MIGKNFGKVTKKLFNSQNSLRERDSIVRTACVSGLCDVVERNYLINAKQPAHAGCSDKTNFT